MSKVEARAAALGAIYAADALGGDIDTSGLGKRAAAMAEGTWKRRADLDAMIARYATGWRIERMPAVDRSVLRLGAFELTCTDTPVGVVVSEAVELAKRYSTERSGRFVNGVLAKVAAEARTPT